MHFCCEHTEYRHDRGDIRCRSRCSNFSRQHTQKDLRTSYFSVRFRLLVADSLPVMLSLSLATAKFAALNVWYPSLLGSDIYERFP